MSGQSAIGLSICISTFNRGRFIAETLDSMIPQVPAGVEILVVNGGSTDRTEECVGAYQRKFPCVRYVRLAANSGVDRDFNTAVELARGEYCWLMSDDDLLKPGAVAAVLKLTMAGYSLIVVNAEVRNGDFSQLLLTRKLAFETDRVYGTQEMDRLFAEVGDYMTFIGCVVIRRSIWLARVKEPYFGSLFIHVGVIFQQPLPGPACAMAVPLISIRHGNAMWQPRDFEIWMFKWPGLIRSLPGLSDSARSQQRRVDPWRYPKTLLYYRAKGSYSMGEYRRWIEPRLSNSKEGRAARLVARVPGALINSIGIIYFKMLGPEWRLALWDLKSSRYYFKRWFSPSR